MRNYNLYNKTQTSIKMTWKELLVSLSELIHEGIESNMRHYDYANVKNKWLGFTPASSKAIEEKERELEITFPKSYIEFLRVTNGFRQISLFAGHLLPVEQVGRLKEIDRDLYDVYLEEENDGLTDVRYNDYSDAQRSEFFRIDHLLESIAISSNVEGSIILLNPKVEFGDECEAWLYASWYPGARRFKSFRELMEHEYRSTLKLIGKKD